MKNRLYNILPFVILVSGITATLFLWNNAVKLNNTKRKDRFNSIVRQVEAAVKDRMATYADAHYAAASLFLTADRVTKRDWRKFVETMNVNDRYPGINGIGYAIEVPKDDSASFLKEVRRDVPGLQITGLNHVQDVDNMFVIKYLEPVEKNLPAIGFDMGSEKTRRSAMERARDSGKPIISRKVTLVQDESQSSGFLLYVPFYKNMSAGDSLKSDIEEFQGWVYAPFITKDFMNGILDLNLREIERDVYLELYDSAIRQNSLVFATTDKEMLEESDLGSVVSIPVFGQEWILRILPTETFLRRYQANQQFLFLVIGILLSFSLFYSAYLLARTRDQAVELAERMTIETRQKNVELQEKNLELERSNRDLEQFAYVASHDLKEPLRMVKAYVQLLEKRYTKVYDEEGRQFIGFVTEGAERMNNLINDLLEYSRVGRIGAEMGVVDAQQVVKNVLSQNELLIEETGAQVIVAELPTLYASENYLYSLFQNLISNGIKFRKENIPPVLKINAEKQEEIWLFSVSDNGIGISESHYDRIFVIFQRLHTRDKYPGTGIGLAVCKKIVEYHGGEIWAESKEGEGTTIYFTLPIYNESKSEQDGDSKNRIMPPKKQPA